MYLLVHGTFIMEREKMSAQSDKPDVIRVTGLSKLKFPEARKSEQGWVLSI
ncbi:hypothetical protein C8D90_102221 [Enterobacillus tribolii]|uniref:Uncharacterized protein n=1 Tax=Enterobacillus tribolii TaxID=1487935 RepID=A0A370R1D4_9GAMM|nr:hypothetical protein C8D90_102221 [Enterobacillus tribolii]